MKSKNHNQGDATGSSRRNAQRSKVALTRKLWEAADRALAAGEMKLPGEVFLATKNYDAMKQFFVDLGLDVSYSDHCQQLYSPFNNEGRNCIIRFGAILVNLEECTHGPPAGPTYLNVGEIGVARLLELITNYSVKDLRRGAGTTSTFQIVSPDGSLVLFKADT